jgi:two-component system, NtrC family, response regulator HydG
MENQKLTAKEWAFFETVARAAFANPFGETRDDLDLVIGGVDPGSSVEEILRAVLGRIEAEIAGLRRRGVADLRRLEGSRREVLRSVFLFHVFHRHLDDFDRLILAQLKDGAVPNRVGFAREVLEELSGFGLTDEETVRFFAVFFQLRRAFYFIKNGLVGSSAAMKTLRRQLWDCVFTHDMRWFESRLWNRMEDFSILLLGATGTGKGAAAAAIGRSGFIPFDPVKNSFTESFTRNFVSINLSQYSAGVLESELFGHKKGAFTGAVEQHDGLFSRCAPHGVIFLDEIGDISIPVQIKLLQVLQERIFFPVGSHEAKRFSGRIVAATNRPLDELMLTGQFREDLYYRLCSDVITLPQLHRRLQEDPAELGNLLDSILVRLLGQTSEQEHQMVKGILKQEVGSDYPWPGNVRELEQAVKRIILTGSYQGVQRGASSRNAGERLALEMKEGSLNAEALLSGYCELLYERFGTYEEVSRRTQLDRRTVKKYVQMGASSPSPSEQG